jgi:hypothetical protein
VCALAQAMSQDCQPLGTDMGYRRRRPAPPFWGAAASCPPLAHPAFDRGEAMP